MLPENRSSSIPLGGFFMSPDDRVTTPIVDYELGGIALNDVTQGLQVKPWKVYLDDVHVYVQPDGGAPTLLFSETKITELALCFDQQMRWTVGYVADGILKLRWFDSSVPPNGARVISVFDQVRNPKMALDDKRPLQLANSDMILAYLKGNSLCYRQQRDRFQIERVLETNLFPGTKLKNIGMNKQLRMQFEKV